MSSTAGPGGAEACPGGLGVDGADGRGACRYGEPQPPPQLLPQRLLPQPLLPQNCACAGAMARHSVSKTAAAMRRAGIGGNIVQTNRTASLMHGSSSSRCVRERDALGGGGNDFGKPLGRFQGAELVGF